MFQVRNLLQGSFVVTVGTIIGGVISYIFSALMGRLLGPSLFGDLGAITSFLLILTAVGGAILTVTMHYSGRYYAVRNFQALKRLHGRFSKTLLITALAVIVVCVLFSPVISRFFGISDQLALVIGLVSLLFSTLIVVNRGILQGTQRFSALSFNNVGELIIKLITAVLLIKLGWALLGATTAIVVSIGIAYIISYLMIRDLLAQGEEATNQTYSEEIDRKDIVNYAWPTLLSTFFLLVVMNLDIILVKKFFEPVIAGQYVAVSTIAKIIFYVTGPISSVMFPLITEQQMKGEKHYQTLFLALVLTLITAGALLGLYYLFEQTIIVALYGDSYRSLGYLLPQSAWLVTFLALVNLMTNYFLSIRKFFFIVFYPIVIGGVLWYIITTHPTVGSVVVALQVGTSLLFSLMLVYYLVMKRRQISSLLGWSDA
jgi:O-antigen/teichoic acid export membrane protein